MKDRISPSTPTGKGAPYKSVILDSDTHTVKWQETSDKWVEMSHYEFTDFMLFLQDNRFIEEGGNVFLLDRLWFEMILNGYMQNLEQWREIGGEINNLLEHHTPPLTPHWENKTPGIQSRSRAVGKFRGFFNQFIKKLWQNLRK